MEKSPFKEQMSDFTKDTGKPLDEFIEEEIPVQKNKFNPVTGKVFTSYDLEKVKTKYIEVPYEKIRCKDGEHIFKIKDVHKWVFSCENCNYSRKVYPVTYRYDEKTGGLFHKITGDRI